jgi:hypothetical protein
MVNENMNVENGQCMPRLCECVLKMVNENAVVKLLMKMPRLCECRKWSMLMFIFKKSYKFVASYVTFVTICDAFVCSQVHKFDVIVFLICNS